MKKYISIFCLLLPFFHIVYGQKIYNGSVVNSKTKVPVPYATVGLIKKNTGTNANEDGKFSIAIDANTTDTLAISCIGYETLILPFDRLPTESLFEMQEKTSTLKEVVVQTKQYNNSCILNKFTGISYNSYTSSGYITQMAQRFQAPIENSLLSEVNIYKEAEGKSLFRIRVYAMDTVTKSPSIDLADTIIEVKSGKEHVRINMEQYKIYIPDRDFFIAVEWLKVPYNFRQLKTKFEGKEIINEFYSPKIYVKKEIETLDKEWQPWHMNYKGKWLHLSDYRSLMISATLKYKS